MGSCFSTKESPSSSSSSLKTSEILPPPNPYLNQIHEITTKEEFEKLINDQQNFHRLIVCDFYAAWCFPCIQVAPILHQWALKEYSTNVIFMKVDVDENEDLANRFSISVLPTFILFKQTKEIERFSGADSHSLKNLINKHK